MSYAQTLQSHFIDSHFTHIWSDGGGADTRFGSRVVHPITKYKQRDGEKFIIDGFMACLEWYTFKRLEFFENPTIDSRDTIECIVYGLSPSDAE